MFNSPNNQARFKLIKEGLVIKRVSDGAEVPFASTSSINPIKKEYEDWVAQGNKVDIENSLPSPNWEKLQVLLRASLPFARVYSESKNRTNINTIFTVMQDTLTSTRNINDLAFALSDLNYSLDPPFSKIELQFLNQALSSCNFPIQLPVTASNPDNFTPPVNWVGLEKAFRASSIFIRIYLSAKESIAVNTIYTLLQDTITSTHSLSDFGFVLYDLAHSINPPLTTEEKDYINLALANNNFNIQI